jgi:hypothetical protein
MSTNTLTIFRVSSHQYITPRKKKQNLLQASEQSRIQAQDASQAALVEAVRLDPPIFQNNHDFFVVVVVFFRNGCRRRHYTLIYRNTFLSSLTY